jgi:hypothetical protein
MQGQINSRPLGGGGGVRGGVGGEMGRKKKISSNFLSLYLLYNPGDIDGAASLSSSCRFLSTREHMKHIAQLSYSVGVCYLSSLLLYFLYVSSAEPSCAIHCI